MQGNAKLTWEWVQCARGMQGNDGKYRGMPRERMVVGAKCQGNGGESH